MTTASDGSENEVLLRGRLADAPVLRDMPSGDTLASFRLTVSRPPGERVRVDSLECTSSRARALTTLGRAQPGDWLEVRGRLHRRFWRSPSGPASRYAVDVTTIKLRTGRRGGA